jgi:hypothetical protein
MVTLITLTLPPYGCVLDFVVSHSTLPMLSMGDMNDIMHRNEKSGPSRPDRRRINVLCDFVKQGGFIDLGYSRPTYTWTNKRFNSAPTFKHLDRCPTNVE